MNEDAARCLVCGTDLSNSEKASRPKQAVQGSRMPEITLSLPAVIGLLALFLGIGAIMVFMATRRSSAAGVVADATATPTITLTATTTMTPTELPPTITSTPEPSPTPQTYIVKAQDTCGGIAFAFGISIQSIVLLNNLPADCSTLYENQPLLIPQPTPTPTPLPSATLSASEATEAACPKVEYTVQQEDTLGSIAANYNVSMDAIREYNGLVNDTVRFGQNMVIPLCHRNPTQGPTPTATLPPPYPGPNLLLPPDGAPFTAADEVISLQWASVGELRSNETYAVTIEDVTEGQTRKIVDYVSDTKFNVPAAFRPNDGVAHVIRWWVMVVRQIGTDDEGNPIWEPAGAASAPYVFTWAGGGAVSTPAP